MAFRETGGRLARWEGMQETVLDDEQGRDPGRRLIRVECTATQEGIAAALRRAFVSIQNPPDDDEFERLLSRIH